jgi:peptidoglycan hydrolase CwlO-like protein
METNIEKRIDDLNQSMLSVSSRVRTLENRSNELKAKITEYLRSSTLSFNDLISSDSTTG